MSLNTLFFSFSFAASASLQDDSEDQVSSSCQESRFVNAGVQTKGSAAQRKADLKNNSATQEEFRLLVEKVLTSFFFLAPLELY